MTLGLAFISDHVAPHGTNYGLNGVCGGERWPNPNDMHTDEHADERRPSTESRAHAQGGE